MSGTPAGFDVPAPIRNTHRRETTGVMDRLWNFLTSSYSLFNSAASNCSASSIDWRVRAACSLAASLRSFLKSAYLPSPLKTLSSKRAR